MHNTARKRRRPGRETPPTAEKTPYEVLDVSEAATFSEIRRAYLARVRQSPPERDPEGFKQAHKAYAVLSDGVQRKTLDLSLFRKELGPNQSAEEDPDFLELFRERVLDLLLASSDFTLADFSGFFLDMEAEVGRLS